MAVLDVLAHRWARCLRKYGPATGAGTTRVCQKHRGVNTATYANVLVRTREALLGMALHTTYLAQALYVAVDGLVDDCCPFRGRESVLL